MGLFDSIPDEPPASGTGLFDHIPDPLSAEKQAEINEVKRDLGLPVDPVAPTIALPVDPVSPALADVITPVIRQDQAPAITLPDDQIAPVEDNSSFAGDALAGLLTLKAMVPGSKVARAVNAISVNDGDAKSMARGASELDEVNQRLADINLNFELRMPKDQKDALVNEFIALSERKKQLELLYEPDVIDQMSMEDAQSTEEAIGVIAENLPRLLDTQQQIADIPLNPAVKASQGKGWEAQIDALKTDPLGVIRTYGVRGAMTSIPGAAGAIAGYLLAGPAGAALGSGALGAETERRAALTQGITDALYENGMENASAEDIAIFAKENPDAFEGIIGKALARAGIIGAVDAATGGIVGKVAGKAAQASTKAKLATPAAGAVIEGVGEGAGEALAGLATEGKVDPSEVVAEVIGGTAIGAPVAAAETAIATKRAVQEKGKPESEIAPQPEEGSAKKRAAVVYTPDNEPVEVEAMVVEAENILTSDQEGYPQELQPRDRDRAASEAQIEGIANNPVAARLDESPETDRGAPIVSDDGTVVESGNGRVIGLRRAYERGSAENYRQYVIGKYPEAANMKNPVIVRRRMSQVDQQDFTAVSNTPATLQMSATENARADARLIDDNIASLYRGGGLANVGNREMIRAFIAKLPKTAQGALVTAEGGLSIEGQERFRNALFHRAYGDDRLLNRLAESPDDDMRSVTNALVDGAGRFVQLKTAIERGEVSPDVDITDDLTAALQVAADFKSRGMDLKAYRAQKDAFATPLPDNAEKLLTAFYNESETRMVSQRFMRDFIDTYIDEAIKQKIDQGELAGIEPVALKSGSEIIDEQTRKARKSEGQQALLDKAEPDRKGSGKSGSKEQRTAGRKGGSRNSEQERLSAPDEEKPKTTGKTQPKGSLGPTFLDFSFTDRNSVFGAAFRAAGMDPKAAVLLDADEQIDTLRKVIYQRYGVRVEFPQQRITRKTITGRKVKESRRRISTRDAIDQLLDAYRQMEMLAHVFGVPHRAMGLSNSGGKSIALSLSSRLKGALGMFSYDAEGNRVIHLPGRSNSFAHEWGHALDHWLGTYLFEDSDGTTMLSRDVTSEGITPGATRNKQIAEAFVGLLQAVFGDRRKLAALQLDLQQQAAQTTKAGKPTPKAKKAQAALEDIAKGKKLPKSVWSKYFKNAKEFDAIWGSKYFQDPAEMIARAMETFAGVKASELSDLPTSFLSKPSWAYTGSEEQRAKLTFPREADARHIFAAFERLGDALRMAEIFGDKGKATKPEDVDVFDLRQWDKWQPRGGLLAQEKEQIAKQKNTLEKYRKEVPTTDIGKNIAKYVSFSANGYLRDLVAKQPKEARASLTNFIDKFAHDPAQGNRTQGETWEEASEAKSKHLINRLDNITSKYNLHNINDAKSQELRRLLTVPGTKSADKNLVEAAQNLRLFLNDIWRYLDQSGVKVGYVKNGWLPRIMDNNAVQNQGEKFLKQAEKVYRIMFTNDVRNAELEDQISDVRRLTSRLGKAVRTDDQGGAFQVNLFSDKEKDTISQWRKLLNAYNKALKEVDAANKEGDGDKIAAAEERAAKALEAFEEVHAEVLDIVEGHFARESAEAWQTRILLAPAMDFDQTGPSQAYLKKRTLPPETDDLMIDFFAGEPVELIYRYVQLAPQRAEYVKRAGANGEILDNLKITAIKKGANSAQLGEIVRVINLLARRGVNQPKNPHMAWASGWVYVAGVVTLLKRVFWSSLAEPTIAGMRTGNAGDSLRAIVSLIGQATFSKNANDRREVARIIGMVTSAQYETIMVNRFGGELDPTNAQGRILANFFRITGLTMLTNAQRTAMLSVTNRAISRHLERALDGNKWAKEELVDLGIAPEHYAAMKEWMDEAGGNPTANDLIGVDGDFFNEAANLYAVASKRLVEQIIQNPKRYSRPVPAMEPGTNLIYAITGFTYSFQSNVLAPIFKRHIDARKEGESAAKFYSRWAYGSSRNLAMVAPAIGVLFVTTVLTTALREAIFNRDKWEEKEKDDELIEWLLARAFSRTGLIGAWDIPMNLYTGVRYQRDLAGAYAGPYVSYFLNTAEAVLALMGDRNSPNTNTAERKATKAVLDLLFVTGGNMAIANLPGGRILGTTYWATLGLKDYYNPSQKITDALFPKE